MIKSIIIKLALILLLFLFNSCKKKKNVHFNDKPDISADVKRVARVKRKKITEGFQSFELPGSSLPIQLLRLGQASDGSYWSVVKFPEAYHRPDSVFLGVEEGYLMIEGELKYSDMSSPQGSYTVIPAEAARVETQTDGVAIAIARFWGKPVWVEKPKTIQAKAIEVSFITAESENRLINGKVEVAYWEEEPQIIDFQGGIIYSLTDSVIVEIIKGEPFPNLSKPFIVWTNQPRSK